MISQYKPFLKWAGGKGQLVEQISHRYPIELGKSVSRYVEPFVGGGAVLFDILSRYTIKEAVINDINAELINMYTQVRDNVEDVISHLDRYEKTFLPLPDSERREYYYQKRDEYNQLINAGLSKQGIISASLFIFLNRTCFNGLYRMNRNGLFNVPMGVYRHPTICNAEGLRLASEALQGVKMCVGDYHLMDEYIGDNTLVYFDPPYRQLKNKGNFAAYTDQCFDDACQTELATFAKKISNKGASFILSNSDPKCEDPTDEFFDELYKDFTIERINADRIISSKANTRKSSTSEILVRNY